MTTDLAVVQQLHNTLDLPERDRGAAEAVAAGLRDAKAGNTRRAYTSTWRQFRTWAEAGGHPALPAAPQAVALYLGHLASTGRSMATVQQARSAISHFHAAAGMGKGDNPALHPVVSEAVKGWRNRAPALSLENPTAHGPARLLVVPSGAFVPHLAGHPGPEAEQLQQVVADADEQPLPVHLRQTPQQELPEAPAVLDLAEHRFNRLHPEGVAFTFPFRPQLAAHPVPGGQSLRYAATGRRWRHPAVAGLLRRDERVHSQVV